MATRYIVTDLRILGFPVVHDTSMDCNVVELRNAKGQRIRIELRELVDEFNRGDFLAHAGRDEA